MKQNQDVVVTGMGLVTALGDRQKSWERLLQQESALKLQQPFSELEAFPLGLIDSTPTHLNWLTSRIVKMALRDARLTPPLPNCGVVVGSSRGCQSQWEKLMAHGFPFEQWLELLPHQVALITAREVGSQGIVFAPMSACATGLIAIARGLELIQMGQCERVIAGAIETPITPLTLAGFKKAGALGVTGCYPFDRYREGLVLGEGGAVFILESRSLAQKRGATIYGQVLGFGLTCDANHISAPLAGGKLAQRAIQSCLTRSGISPKDIDYIHAHGTSTRLNDEMEANLIQSLFPPSVKVSSTKGATGHTLGASGAIGVGFSLLALQHQISPPNVGLSQPDFPLHFVREAETAPLNHALCLSFGFGGQNLAIALGRD